ncbi:MAG TPA: hypothetical protein VM324_06535 [Egibacteraceae bacterium]|nr:hypothetical protein [Egibacteraceae bacterium]
MYTSTEDARSDLFLAGAVFAFGGILVQFVLAVVPLNRIPGAAPVLAVVLPLVTTVLVPFLLIRYRKEPWSMYGLGGFSAAAFASGALLGVPIVVAGLVAAVVAGVPVDDRVPLLAVADPVRPLARAAQWLGYALLAAYGTVKARDAFTGYPEPMAPQGRRIAGLLAAAAAVALVLLLVSLAARGALLANLGVAAALVLFALGVGASVLLALSRVPARATATRAVLLTPAVLLGLAGLHLTFEAVAFVFTIYNVGLLALVGLLVGVLQEGRRTAWGPIGLALVVALLTGFAEGALLR